MKKKTKADKAFLAKIYGTDETEWKCVSAGKITLNRRRNPDSSNDNSFAA